MGCAFLGVQKFFWDTKDQSDCFGIQKIVLDIFGGQRDLINCLIVLDILESLNRQGWGSTVGDPKSSRNRCRKQQQTGKAAPRSRSSKNNRSHKQQEHQHKHQEPHKQKQVAQTTKSTKQQQHRKKAPKRISKSSTNNSKSSAKAAQTVQTATKAAKAATETRGPRRRGTEGLFRWF